MNKGINFKEQPNEERKNQLITTNGNPTLSKKNGEIIRLYPLTEMETQIVKLLVGKLMSNKEIAVELGKSLRTIEGHRYRLMKKLKTKNAIALTKKVIKMGLAKL